MATKTCPSCGEDVPVAASRCKHCFHDFTEVQKKRNPLVGMLAFLAVLLIALLAMIMFPDLVLWLPRSLGY